MGVFDEILIQSGPGTQLASFSKGGPLEPGAFNPQGTWVPNGDVFILDLPANTFGIEAATGLPYFDTSGASPGEDALLYLDPINFLLWLQPTI